MSEQPSAPAGPPRLAELEAGDALRAWGVATVVLFHMAAGILLLDTGGADWRVYGHGVGSLLQGVQANIYMFFGLSAFLLARPYVRAAMFPEASRFPSTRRYVRHRAGRILPAFYATVVVVLVTYGMQGSDAGDLIAILGFAQVYHHGDVANLIDHAWSIDVEALFYVLLVPLGFFGLWSVRRWGGRTGGAVALGAVLVVATVGTLLESWGIDNPPIPISQSPLGGLRSFVPGVLLAVLVVRFPGPAFWQRAPRWVSWLLLLVGLFLSWRMPHWAPEGDNLRLYIGTLSGGCVLAAAVVHQYSGRPMWRLLRGRVVQWVGERSYSIYLIHGVVFYALRNVGDEQPTPLRRLLVCLLVTVPAILAAAQAMFLLVERPGMNLARRRRATDREGLRPTAPDPLVADGAAR